jgi:hypothetical protein
MVMLRCAVALLAQDAVAWETPVNDDLRNLATPRASSSFVMIVRRADILLFERATGAALPPIDARVPPAGGRAAPIELVGGHLLLGKVVHDVRAGTAVDTKSTTVLTRSGDAYYGFTDDSLVRYASDGRTDWRQPLKQLRQSSIDAVPDGGVVLRGGTQTVAKSLTKISAKGKAEWSWAMPEADAGALETAVAHVRRHDDKDLALVAGKVKGTDAALWFCVLQGRAKRVVLKEVEFAGPSIDRQQRPMVFARGAGWFGVTAGRGKDRQPTVVVVDLVEGKELRRLAQPAVLTHDGYWINGDGLVVDLATGKETANLKSPPGGWLVEGGRALHSARKAWSVAPLDGAAAFEAELPVWRARAVFLAGTDELVLAHGLDAEDPGTRESSVHVLEPATRRTWKVASCAPSAVIFGAADGRDAFVLVGGEGARASLVCVRTGK